MNDQLILAILKMAVESKARLDALENSVLTMQYVHLHQRDKTMTLERVLLEFRARKEELEKDAYAALQKTFPAIAVQAPETDT
jgi:hypothetical protein